MSTPPGTSTHPPPVEGEPRPPNILTIILDCARAKSFRLSGGRRVAKTPVIDGLAGRGTSFPRTVAPANWTVPSHMSIMTGSYPNAHGMRTFQRNLTPPETIASWVHRRGMETALFTEMVHLAAGYGLESGYDKIFSRKIGVSDEQRTVSNRLAGRMTFLYSAGMRRLIERLPPFIVPLNFVNHPQEVAYKEEVCGDYLRDEFTRWLSQRDSTRPFHAFFNLVDAHEPYPLVESGTRLGFLDRWYARTPRYYLLSVPGLQSHVPWTELEGGYLYSIEQADRKIGELLAALKSHDELDRTMVVVTADHGQSFGEGGNVYHGCGATDSITRVPLVVAPPKGVRVPSLVDRWVSLCELSSWIRAAVSGEVPYDAHGMAPFPFSAGAPDSSIVFCEGGPASDPNRSLQGIRLDQMWNHRLLAAYRGPEKFVLDMHTEEVFRWENAPDTDLVEPQRYTGEAAARLRQDVFGAYEQQDAARRQTLATEPPPIPVSLDERLRSWGYD